MSFEHAPYRKVAAGRQLHATYTAAGLMVGVAMTSILVGVFDVKHYFHLQYWRLAPPPRVLRALGSDLFIAEILLYNIAVQIERQFGSLKFASFAVISTLLATLLEFISLILFHRAGLNYFPSGPSALIFSIIYQYSRIVPSAYIFRIFGLPLTNKSFTYIFASQLALGHLPGSAAAAAIGVLAGQIYRSDLANFKGYRIPPWLVALAAQFLLPLIGSLRPARRSNRALPDESAGADDAARPQNDEVITTARRAPTAAHRAHAGPNPAGGRTGSGTGGSVVREWVEGLTARAPAGIRIPTDAEITQLTAMFPDIQRDVLVSTLQRSPNIESAVETLLSSQTIRMGT